MAGWPGTPPAVMMMPRMIKLRRRCERASEVRFPSESAYPRMVRILRIENL